jgi:hypothetical protein
MALLFQICRSAGDLLTLIPSDAQNQQRHDPNVAEYEHVINVNT